MLIQKEFFCFELQCDLVFNFINLKSAFHDFALKIKKAF